MTFAAFCGLTATLTIYHRGEATRIAAAAAAWSPVFNVRIANLCAGADARRIARKGRTSCTDIFRFLAAHHLRLR
jgi:hypothetical protein